MSCITVLGLLIGARTPDEKDKALLMATGISAGFCGCSWAEGDKAETVQEHNSRYQEPF